MSLTDELRGALETDYRLRAGMKLIEKTTGKVVIELSWREVDMLEKGLEKLCLSEKWCETYQHFRTAFRLAVRRFAGTVIKGDKV